MVLEQLSANIIEQSVQFESFLNHLTEAEISEKNSFAGLFARAEKHMPLYKRQIDNLRTNLGYLSQVGSHPDYLDCKRAS